MFDNIRRLFIKFAEFSNTSFESYLLFIDKRFPSLSKYIRITLDTVLVGTSYSASILTKIVADSVLEVLKGGFGFTQQDQISIQDRTERASKLIMEAGIIITDLQKELTENNNQLNEIVSNIQLKREEAEHWRALASTNQQLANALIKEIEQRVGNEIRKQLERDKNRRRIISIIVWIITLLLGAFLGAIVQEWWQNRGY